MIRLNVNGKAQQLDVAPDTPLLWALRDTLHLTGTKYGCGMALCGACTVHLDGAAIRSCVTPVSATAGKQITTIEGIGATAAGIDSAMSGNVCRCATYVRIRAAIKDAAKSA